MNRPRVLERVNKIFLNTYIILEVNAKKWRSCDKNCLL
jgi:hypothetical protein